MRRNMYRYTGAAAAVIFLAAIVTGCSGRWNQYGLDPGNPQTITVWHYYNGIQAADFTELVDDFNSTVGEELGIVVTAESKSSVTDLAEAVRASAEKKVGAEPMPDIFQCYPDNAAFLSQEDILVNLDDYVSRKEKAEYCEAYIEAGTINEVWNLFPVAKATEVMILNKTVFESFSEACGVSEDDLATWEGLAGVAEKYYEWSGGQSFFGRDAFANYMIAGSSQLGSDIIISENGKVRLQLDRDINRRLWDNYYIPYLKGYYGAEGRYRSDDVKVGLLAGIVCSTSGAAFFPDEVPDASGDSVKIDYKVLPVPGFEGTESVLIQQGADMAVAKSVKSREYASVRFLKWITATEQNAVFALESGYLPVKKESVDEKILQSFAKKSRGAEVGIVYDTIMTAMSEIKTADMVSLPGIVGGDEIRKILENSMMEYAKSDRADLLREIEAGTDREMAIEPYLTDQRFEEWYGNLNRELQQVLD